MLELSELKDRLTQIEPLLDNSPIVEFTVFDTRTGRLSLFLTSRLRKACRKGRVWKSTSMLTALKNSQYGFDRIHARSRGGSDGIFLLDRAFEPSNEMMRKIFDRFLDKPDVLVQLIVDSFAVVAADLLPVRVVSHHLRLIGVLFQGKLGTHLILVDFDDEKDH